MTLTSSTSAQSVTAALFGQLRVQQAQRNAERAEQQAQALQSSARAAQVTADRAQEGARSLQIQADQATGNAGQARQGVAALRSVAEGRAELGARVERVAENLRARNAEAVPAAPVAQPSPPVEAPAAVRPVVNVDGQTTGTLINVKA